MKTLIAIASIVCSFFTAEAQQITNSAPNAVQNLINEGSAWLTTPDTNSTTLELAANRIETGPVLQSGLTIADEVFIQHNFSGGKLALISQTENASIAGTIVYQGLGLGYNIYQKYDTEVTAYIAGGYRFDTSKMQGGFGAKVRHMLNKAAYIAPGVELDFSKHTTPKVTAEVGLVL